MPAKPKRGRPSIGDAARVKLNVRVAPVTAEAIEREAEERDLSRGAVVDDLAKRLLAKQRRP